MRATPGWLGAFAILAAGAAAAGLVMLATLGEERPPPPPAGEPPAAAAAGPRTVLWFFAHADDEALAAAGALLRSVERGDRNVVVFATDGGAVEVEELPDLPRETITASREAEARAALALLGVRHVRFLGMRDGALTVQDARASLRRIVAGIHAPVAVRGHSPWDPYQGQECGHPDHCVIGVALVEAARAGEISDLVMYRIGHLLGEAPAGDGCSPLDPWQHRTKQRMRAEYERLDLAADRYGIGGRSVPNGWAATEHAPECWDLPRADPLPDLPAHLRVRPDRFGLVPSSP